MLLPQESPAIYQLPWESIGIWSIASQIWQNSECKPHYFLTPLYVDLSLSSQVFCTDSSCQPQYKGETSGSGEWLVATIQMYGKRIKKWKLNNYNKEKVGEFLPLLSVASVRYSTRFIYPLHMQLKGFFSAFIFSLQQLIRRCHSLCSGPWVCSGLFIRQKTAVNHNQVAITGSVISCY